MIRIFLNTGGSKVVACTVERLLSLIDNCLAMNKIIQLTDEFGRPTYLNKDCIVGFEDNITPKYISKHSDFGEEDFSQFGTHK